MCDFSYDEALRQLPLGVGSDPMCFSPLEDQLYAELNLPCRAALHRRGEHSIVEEMRPPAGRLIVTFGKLKWASLTKLKNSVWKSSENRLPRSNVREIIMSRLTRPGPSMIQAAASPNVKRAETSNAPISDQRSGVRSVRGRLPSRMRLGRCPRLCWRDCLRLWG